MMIYDYGQITISSALRFIRNVKLMTDFEIKQVIGDVKRVLLIQRKANTIFYFKLFCPLLTAGNVNKHLYSLSYFLVLNYVSDG